MRNLKKSIVAASLALCLLGIGGSQAFAYNSIANSWKNTYVDVCPDLTAAANDCSLCHVDGFNLNPYGSDVAGASNNFLSIEGTDSDGDGRTNGQEISQDCTLPGDETSVPVSLTTWSHIKALFR